MPSKHHKTSVKQGEFHNGSSGKESACNAEATGDTGLIPGSGRPPGGGNDNPLQYSCLENPWTENLVRYSPWGHKEYTTEATEHGSCKDAFQTAVLNCLYLLLDCELCDAG